MCFGPVKIVSMIIHSSVLTVLDEVLCNIYSLFVWALWAYISISTNCSMQANVYCTYGSMSITLVLLALIVCDTWANVTFECHNVNEWASVSMTGRDWVMLGVFGFVLLLSYVVFLVTRRSGQAARVDISTYTVFVAQFYHMFDEILLRMKNLRHMCLGREMRHIGEVASVVVMVLYMDVSSQMRVQK